MCNRSFSKEALKCVSVNNQPRKARPTIVNISSNETLLYPFTVSVDKCGRSCNTIDDPYPRVCVSNKVENINVFNF